jgi:hypothetical protein
MHVHLPIGFQELKVYSLHFLQIPSEELHALKRSRSWRKTDVKTDDI